MTTGKQSRANQANAQKSTGPKTRAGRAVSASNSRKHGLTSLPPWDDITRYYRIILNDGQAIPDPMASDERARAALALAETEAQRARCLETERAHLMRMHERAGDGAFVDEEVIHKKLRAKDLDLDVMKMLLEQSDDPDMTAMLKLLVRIDPERPAELTRRWKALRRYRREAEARRRKALARWIAVLEATARDMTAEQGWGSKRRRIA